MSVEAAIKAELLVMIEKGRPCGSTLMCDNHFRTEHQAAWQPVGSVETELYVFGAPLTKPAKGNEILFANCHVATRCKLGSAGGAPGCCVDELEQIVAGGNAPTVGIDDRPRRDSGAAIEFAFRHAKKFALRHAVCIREHKILAVGAVGTGISCAGGVESPLAAHHARDAGIANPLLDRRIVATVNNDNFESRVDILRSERFETIFQFVGVAQTRNNNRDLRQFTSIDIAHSQHGPAKRARIYKCEEVGKAVNSCTESQPGLPDIGFSLHPGYFVLKLRSLQCAVGHRKVWRAAQIARSRCPGKPTYNAQSHPTASLALMQTRIDIASAADENYAMPLAAMLASVRMHLDTQSYVDVHLLSLGISDKSRQKIAASIGTSRMVLHWHEVDESILRSLDLVLRPEDHISLASYARLLIPELISTDCERLIYLDCDLVCTRSIADLWMISLDDCPLLAARETVTGVKTASDKAGIRAWRELRLANDMPLFNAGVMVLDVVQWRKRQLARLAFAYLRSARDYVRWHDQEAINVVLRGNWKMLPDQWNVSTFQTGSKKDKYATQESVLPAIIHYNSEVKPWQSNYSLPYAKEFFEALDHSAWRGWRPTSERPGTPYEFRRRISKALRKRYGNIGRWWALQRKRRIAIKLLADTEDSWPGDTDVPTGELRAFCVTDRLDEDIAMRLRSLLGDGVDRIFVAVRYSWRENAVTTTGNSIISFPVDPHEAQDIVLRKMLYRYGSGHWCLLSGSVESVCVPRLGLGTVEQVYRYLQENKIDALPVNIRSGNVSGNAQVAIHAIEQDPFTGEMLSGPARIDTVGSSSQQPLHYASKTPLFRYRRFVPIASGHVIVGTPYPANFFGELKAL